MRKTRFCIEGGPPYVGYTDDQHWNGWAVPYFEKAVADRMVADYTADGQFQAFYDAAADTYHFQMEAGVPFGKVVKTGSNGMHYYDGWDSFRGVDVVVNGQKMHLYPIGAGYWCWEEVNA